MGRSDERDAESVTGNRDRHGLCEAGVCERPGTAIEIEIRGKRFGAVVVPKPIYCRKS